MSLDVYRRFLTDYQSASLASDLSLSYIPTTTKIEGADAVRSHLSKQHRIVQTKAQNILSVVEGTQALCVDVETTLEFENGGGAYLPSLDDNFLTGRVASFPTLHIVRFNANLQIQNVRIHWDQAALLRLVEVISPSRSRGWPIREAEDQTKMIKSVIAATPAVSAPAPAPVPEQTTAQEAKAEEPDVKTEERPGTPVGRRRIRDPYAAESLTDLLSPGSDRTEPVRAPRAGASARPPQRDLGDILVADDNVPTEAERRSASPSKPGPVAPKVGAGRNFQGNRLFDDDDTVAKEEGGHHQIAYKTNPHRFNHFDIGGDNSEREVQEKPVGGRSKSQHTTQWAFDDFVTPEKPRRALRGQEINQFPWTDVEPDRTPLPPRHPVLQPRRDAQTHFDLTDDAHQPTNNNNGRIISSFQNKGHDLYRDPILDSAEEEEPEDLRQDNNLNKRFSAAMNGPRRQRNFESHWDLTDSSPQAGNNTTGGPNKAGTSTITSTSTSTSEVNDENQNPAGQDRSRAVKMMEPHWETYDDSPQRPSVKAPPSGVRGAYQRSWDMGE